MQDKYLDNNYLINLDEEYLVGRGVGFLKITTELTQNKLKAIKPHIGLSHRGIEKIAETKTYNQNILYMDKLDFVATLCNEHAYVLAIEKLLNIKPPLKAQYIRVMLDELSRIFSHLSWLEKYLLNLDLTSYKFLFSSEKEDILACFQAVAASRFNLNYYTIGGVTKDLPHQMTKYKLSHGISAKNLAKLNANRCGSLLDFISDFTVKLANKLENYLNLFNENKILRQRSINIGIISPEKAIALGFSGPVLRGSGVSWDLRQKQPYAVYAKLKFDVPIGKNGDNYDRYFVRMTEMIESNKIVQQTCNWLNHNLGPINLDNYKITPPNSTVFKNDLNALIHHCKLYTEGYSVPKGDTYAAVEHPNGEFGIYVVSDGANKPYRLKIRTASFAHLAGINEIFKGYSIEDLIMSLVSLNLSVSEIDR